MQVLTAQQAQPSEAAVPTLLFLPHCESDFTTTVMRANAAALHSIAMLGAHQCHQTPIRMLCNWFVVMAPPCRHWVCPCHSGLRAAAITAEPGIARD